MDRILLIIQSTAPETGSAARANGFPSDLPAVPDGAFMSPMLETGEQDRGGACPEFGSLGPGAPSPLPQVRRTRPESARKDRIQYISAGHPVELEPLYGDYPLDQAYDEMREPSGVSYMLTNRRALLCRRRLLGPHRLQPHLRQAPC